MEFISHDSLFEIFKYLDLKEISNACQVCRKFCLVIDNSYWNYKLRCIQEDIDFLKFIFKKDKDIYGMCLVLCRIKKDFKIDWSLKELFFANHIILNCKEIERIPKEIQYLSYLRFLSLCQNKIKEIPKEIGSVRKLERLHLPYNQIKEIPIEIKNLKNLWILDISNNMLEKIPRVFRELSDMTNLRVEY